MKYSHIARYVNETPWAILPEKLDEIVAILEFHIGGGTFTAEEIKARIGDPPAADPGRRGAVAVLPFKGVISHRMGGMSEMSGGMSTERFAGMLRQALADDQVGSILIDIDSPGGTIAGVTELHAELLAARGKKPIMAHINALGASAAYWIASAADEIVATPSAMVGSIGVITAHVDSSKSDEAEGVTRTVISAGKYQAEAYGPLTDEAKAAIQARVDEAYAVMVKDIAKGRDIKASEVRSGFGEGRVVSAARAKELGMIDRIATAEDTIGRLTGRRASSGMRAEELEPAIAATVVETPIDAEADRRRRLQLL